MQWLRFFGIEAIDLSDTIAKAGMSDRGGGGRLRRKLAGNTWNKKKDGQRLGSKQEKLPLLSDRAYK